MRFLSVLAAGSQQLARRFLVRTSLAFACALSGTIGLGFATCALFEALRLQYGVVNASIGLAAIYVIVAGILYLCYRRAGPTPIASAPSGLSQPRAGNAEALKAAAQASEAPQAVALAMSVDLVKQMTPLQLTMLAVISGFVAGRRL
ncbi:MAG: hypothetical protein ABSC25_18575 [Roseiarcus sp.]|jgi:hypothetical protein